MLNEEQQRWLSRLSDTDSVVVVPFDPACQQVFQEVKAYIQKNLGEELRVEHHGASSLGISGQDEIDVYILVKPDQFDQTVLEVQNLFGKPERVGALKRARFKTIVQGKKIDLFVSNEEHEEWKRNLAFKNYLLKNPLVLADYKKIKENATGKSTREYYRAKIEFINDIIEKLEYAGEKSN